ncbi:MAG: glycoside hydrolase family 3 protein [Lachnospiraceae bacterium]|nr:glycoside hydrolase family 3 protein [Lachnospiraceae bacterium]
MKGKKLIKVLSAVLASALFLASCGKAEEASVSSETWISSVEELSEKVSEPRAEEAVDEQAIEEAKKIYLNKELPVAERVEALLSVMTIEEKAYQCVQGEQDNVSVEDVKRTGIGSVLSGGGSDPVEGNLPEHWQKRVNELKAAALETRLGIPLLYGIDAVHGNNNIYGATVFPHNIGLGAANDPELMEEIAHVVAREVRAIGVQYSFAPCLANPQNERWGRTYEGFSEKTADVARLAGPFVAALQGDVQGDEYMPEDTVIACAKHYIGEGYTAEGVNQGNVEMPAAEFDELLAMGVLDPYKACIDNNVLTVMPSYNSIDGLKCHENKHLLTDVLKEQLGFKGMVISDYNAIGQCSGTYDEEVANCMNAGVDMFMEAQEWDRCAQTIIKLVKKGEISEERLDDAVSRILRVKFMSNMFDEEVGPAHENELFDEFGSEENREVARRAVRESLVLLKNGNVDGKHAMEKIKEATNITVCGSGAFDIGRQCGGWTISWQGEVGNITLGTPIVQGIYDEVKEYAKVSHSVQGELDAASDVIVTVVGENPYAESDGDVTPSGLKPISGDIKLLETVEEQIATNGNNPLKVLIIISGRPIDINDYVDKYDAVIMAFLPGTEGEGIADVLFGDYDFTGTLPITWVKDFKKVDEKHELSESEILFPYGFGLNKTGELLIRE